MAAGNNVQNIEYGSDWDYAAVFPINLSGSNLEIEILENKNDRSECRLVYATNASVSKDSNISLTQTSVSPVEYTISLRVPATTLIRKVGAGKFHWRLYITFPSGLKEMALGGKFNYRESV